MQGFLVEDAERRMKYACVAEDHQQAAFLYCENFKYDEAEVFVKGEHVDMKLHVQKVWYAEGELCPRTS